MQRKYENEMWKHDQSNMVTPSAVFAANGMFIKGNNFETIIMKYE
jgi:hypothetical protein